MQPNKAVVGRNAFQHESGIHQDGVLKERSTYEIMSAASVGIDDANSIVLGKHSGRHALQSALMDLGYQVSGQTLNQAFKRFKEIADKKKQVTALDLEALVTDELRADAGAYTLEWFDVEASTRRPPHATVSILTPAGESVRGDFTGDGPIDAVFRAINAATTREVKLRDFRIDAITSGQDALGEASVVLELSGQNASGQGVSTDIIEAAALAYIRALSNVEGKVILAAESAENEEPVSPRRRSAPALRVAAVATASRRLASIRFGPIAFSDASSGTIVVTVAPRPRRADVSRPMASDVAVRSGVSAAPAVGTSASTREPLPLGTASRLVGLQTPPSTYSRSPICTGANSHGTEQEASTASATVARGASGAPNMTRLPLERSTAEIRSRPSKRAPRASMCPPRPPSVRSGRGARRSTTARATPSGGRGHRQRHVRERRRGGAGGLADHREPRRLRLLLDLVRDRARPLAGGALAGVGAPPGGERRGHDRARGRAEQVLALAEVQAREASSPFSTPRNHASPSVPPAPSTRASGPITMQR